MTYTPYVRYVCFAGVHFLNFPHSYGTTHRAIVSITIQCFSRKDGCIPAILSTVTGVEIMKNGTNFHRIYTDEYQNLLLSRAIL